MPLTAKGEKIKAAMEQEYGSEKGEQVFYASRNAGTISGVDSASVPALDPVKIDSAMRAVDALCSRMDAIESRRILSGKSVQTEVRPADYAPYHTFPEFHTAAAQYPRVYNPHPPDSVAAQAYDRGLEYAMRQERQAKAPRRSNA